MRSSAYAVAGLAALALGAAGCGSSNKSKDTSAASTPASTPAPAASTPATSTPAASGGAGGTLTIAETEFKLSPKTATTKAGQVTITVKNAGQTIHNLEVQGNGVEKKSADLQPGASGKVTANLKAGKYTMYCTIDGHRASGMEGTLTVS
jgi:uncharacterized cupredoxin-like copper-binding protein